MKDLLLVFASPKNRKNFINTLPPAGILYLAAYLEKQGHSVDVVDCNVSGFSFGQSEDYRVIGFSINIANIENSLDLIRKLTRKNPQATLIAGGPLPSAAPETFFPFPLKAIFISEAEKSLDEYLRHPDSQNQRGYYFRDGGGNWLFNGPRQHIPDLDELPFPALDKIDLRKYYTPVKKSAPVSILISSRGCPFKCTFCCQTMGSKYRMRSAANVVSEIEWQVKKLGVKEIAVYDDNFTLDAQRVEDICDLIREKGILVNLQLTNGVRADSLNRRLLEKMKLAGFWMIAFAPESGNPQTLERINKGFGLDKVKQCLAWCREAGIKTWAFFIVGFPWENDEMFEKTVNFSAAIDADIVHFTNCVPLPGTELYSQVYGQDAAWKAEDSGFFCSRRLPGNNLTARAYRKAYFKNPGRILRLLRVFSLPDLIRIIWYTVTSRNIC